MTDVLVDQRGFARVLTCNRPERLNAISTQMLGELEASLHEAVADDGVRVVIVTGAGARAFIAGADITEYAAQDHEDFVAYQAFSRRVFSVLDGLSKPVIAAVNGYALGGGFEVALCADLIVASEGASFGLPEAMLGLCPGGGGTQRLTRAVGPFVAADVLLRGRRLTAAEAQAHGLVARVVPAAELPEAALEVAGEIAGAAPLPAAEMLDLVRTAIDSPLEAGLTAEQEALSRLRRSQDAEEGIRAFVEKREPRFEGR